jgi:quercetin dioxygenase-like cupin family protein
MTAARRIAIAAVLALGAASLAGAAEEQLRLRPAEIAKLPTVGGVAGTSRAKGTVTTVLSGDPSKPGLYTISISVPANTKIGPHSHRDDRTAVVVSGKWFFGYGSSADPTGLKELSPGSFYTEPGGTPHVAATKDEPVTIYITGYGPTDTIYVNAADDPSKR